MFLRRGVELVALLLAALVILLSLVYDVYISTKVVVTHGGWSAETQEQGQ